MTATYDFPHFTRENGSRNYIGPDLVDLRQHPEGIAVMTWNEMHQYWVPCIVRPIRNSDGTYDTGVWFDYKPFRKHSRPASMPADNASHGDHGPAIFSAAMGLFFFIAYAMLIGKLNGAVPEVFIWLGGLAIILFFSFITWIAHIAPNVWRVTATVGGAAVIANHAYKAHVRSNARIYAQEMNRASGGGSDLNQMSRDYATRVLGN